MTTYKTKRRGRKTVRGHRQSTSGKILPPLDVRSNNMMGELTKRIREGPITMIMVYADWCGHCHHMMPHFKEAAKSPNRSVQAVMLNETMLHNANSSINSSINRSAEPIKVDGYPSILLVDRLGNKVTEIDAVKSTPTMTRVMNESGSLAENAGITSVNGSMVKQPSVNRMSINKMSINHPSINRPMLSMVERNEPVEEFVENVIENEIISPATNIEGMRYTNIKPVTKAAKPNIKQAVGMEQSGMAARSSKQSLGDIDSFSVMTQAQDEAFPITPPTGHDLHSINDHLSENKKVGGSLYDAMARSAYVLAPTAALLATSALMMKRRHRKTHRNKHSKKRSNRRN
uniref:Thioredoxin domain-containing protein n=1 Tax=viral metagenome TaxID=1070528 RepID=A0A6C0KQZ8_9ZZZZ